MYVIRAFGIVLLYTHEYNWDVYMHDIVRVG